jgi:hypothetical protein
VAVIHAVARRAEVEVDEADRRFVAERRVGVVDVGVVPARAWDRKRSEDLDVGRWYEALECVVQLAYQG